MPSHGIAHSLAVGVPPSRASFDIGE
jgi:hypothetical protein